MRRAFGKEKDKKIKLNNFVFIREYKIINKLIIYFNRDPVFVCILDVNIEALFEDLDNLEVVFPSPLP